MTKGMRMPPAKIPQTNYIIGDADIFDVMTVNIKIVFADRESMDDFYRGVDKIYLFRIDGMLYSLGEENTLFCIEEEVFKR